MTAPIVWRTIGPAEREYGFRAGPTEWIGDWPEIERIVVLDDSERKLDIEPEEVPGMTPLLLSEIRGEILDELEPPWEPAKEPDWDAVYDERRE